MATHTLNTDLVAVGSGGGAPAFQNGWSNYGLFSTFGAGYFKDSHGIVHLRGVIKGTTIDTVAFTLPAGYRPAGGIYAFAVLGSGATVAQVNIDSNGNVTPVAGTTAFIGLDGISFLAEG